MAIISPRRYRSCLTILALAGALFPAGFVSADTIWLKSPGAKTALEFDNVKIEKVDGENLLFISSSGNETHKKLAEISQVALDDEPALTAAEDAYSKGDFAGSIDGYRKAATDSSKPWVRERAAFRLIDAGTKVPDFQASVAGFATLATFDADAAQRSKPAIPANASASDLKTAANAVQNAAGAKGLSADQQRALLNFQVELLSAAKDTDGASAALNMLSKLGGSSAASAGGSPDDNLAASRARVDQKLNEARVAFAQKDYQKASSVLLGAGDGITSPDQQDEALFLLAQAKEQLAGDDPKALMDAAIAYMRVVANFQKVPGALHIPDALMKTAAIEEKIAKPEEALKIYNDVATAFPGTASAQSASDNAARISAALKAANKG
jgi:TolA-binding protein